MRVVLTTICLNEMEWLPALYEQHRGWPGLERWVFVEAADAVYAQTNPGMVSPLGLSVDGTSDFLSDLRRKDDRVVYLPHGLLPLGADPAQGKCAAKNHALLEANKVCPSLFVTLDADEMYTREDQARIPSWLRDGHQSVSLKFRHPWRPPSLVHEPLFRWEVRGGFWEMVHCHIWRWQRGLRYSSNHNTPETARGVLLNRSMFRGDRVGGSPQCVHLAFSSSLTSRRAKHAYYQARGEGRTDKRGWYVASRAAWEEWKPGHQLPRGAEVVPYFGPVPEVFREEQQA